MSGTPEERALLDAAGPTRARAAEWLARRESEQWGEAEQAALEAWLGESDANRVAYLRVESAWSQAQRLPVVHRPFERPLAKPATRSWHGSARIAAVFALTAGIGAAAALHLFSPHGQVFSTPLGGRETITLNDGSVIELNTDTTLRADITADKRTLWLEKGEVYFKVVHDARHPFEVIAGKHRVTDIGTQFTVRRDGDRLRVSLLEGSVRFDATGQGGQKPVTLKPGEELLATATDVTVFPASTRRVAKELGWRKGQLIFDNTALSDAAAEFNRYNRKKIVIADAAAGRRAIGASFAVNDVELFARMAKAVLGLRVENTPDEIIISSSGHAMRGKGR
jgi:transmembrane sensor